MLVAEKDSAGHLKVSYTNGKGEVISRTTWTTNGTTGVTSPESTIFFLYDGSGNVNVVLDEQGTVLKRLDYDVFGAERDTGYDSGANNSNAESNRMTFSGTVGHVGEPDLDLIYMRARFCDPALGRFISEDPGQNGSNWYVYCDSDPVNFTDPSGAIKEIPIPGCNGWTYRIDRRYLSGATKQWEQDVTIIFKGKEMGSFGRYGGGWKHGPNGQIPGEVGGWLGKKFGLAYDSVTTTFEQDPLFLAAVLLDINGDSDDATVLLHIAGDD